MAEAKNILKLLHYIMVTYWGFNILDLIGLSLEAHTYWGIIAEETIKVFMAIAGLVYFIYMIIHKRKMNRLNRDLKQQEIDRYKIETELILSTKMKSKRKRK